MSSPYSIVEKGSPYSKDYRVYFVGPSGYVSPFHDIPLYASEDDKIFNMIVEIPRWTNAKMEICRDEKLNPIKQDIKKDKLRYVDNCFPHHGYMWNYGAFPQTWENPTFTDPDTEQKGDNDPIDVCEIGHKVKQRGDVVPVKVLGIMALIDEGETDWKLITIDINDPLAPSLHDIDDVEKQMPGFLQTTKEWFRIYKIPTGKPENQFAFSGQAKNRAFALDKIKTSHGHWLAAMGSSEKLDAINRVNTTVLRSSLRISQQEAKAIVDSQKPRGAASAMPPDVDKWNYIK